MVYINTNTCISTTAKHTKAVNVFHALVELQSTTFATAYTRNEKLPYEDSSRTQNCLDDSTKNYLYAKFHASYSNYCIHMGKVSHMTSHMGIPYDDKFFYILFFLILLFYFIIPI